MAKSVLTLGLLAWGLSVSPAQKLLWDNNIRENGVSGHPVSPPSFPNIRVVDDFVISEDSWLITGFHCNLHVDANWIPGAVTEVFIREDNFGSPGRELVNVVVPHSKMSTGRILFGRAVYLYWIEDLAIPLDTGTYWIGLRHPQASGTGTAYWSASDAGPDGQKTDHSGWLSFDSGNTWVRVAELRHKAFEIYGKLPIEVFVQAFEIVRGERLSGGLISLLFSDDRHLLVEARRPSSVSQPSIQVVVDTKLPGGSPRILVFELEASAMLRVPQWIDFYDFDAGQWERLDTREATTNDSVAKVTVKNNVSRFIEPGTARVRARVSWYDPGVSVAGWFARIDQVLWKVPDE